MLCTQAKGIFPKQHKEQEENSKQNPQIGTLRTMTQLIIDLVQVRISCFLIL